MSGDSFVFEGADGSRVFTWCWKTPLQKPVGVLQIFHGMAEHALRYAEFARHLNQRGFDVYACDQRGHGRTGEPGNSLFHMESDGFDGIVQDQRRLSELIGEKYPDTPLFILGHSFGSFLAQEYAKRYSDSIAGMILSGSAFVSKAEIKAGLLLASASLLFGKHRPNRLLDKITFGSYNKRIVYPESRFSWLSRDKDEVAKYDADPFCGQVMSTGFFLGFFKGLDGLCGLYGKTAGNKPRKDLPIFIISGSEDPVGGYGKGVSRLYEWYGSAGFTDVELKLYDGARHEMLNEINRGEVYGDIAAWLESHMR
jgi:alpha-beta hydrolase superfamily lysophospholipase